MRLRSLAALAVLACAAPASAEEQPELRPDLPVLEQAWHGCVRDAYERQPDRGGRAVRDRTALDACKPHENAYVSALMAARPDGDPFLHGWAKTWAAYVAYVVDPVAAWIEALRR